MNTAESVLSLPRVSSPSGVVFSRCSGCKRAFYCSNEARSTEKPVLTFIHVLGAQGHPSLEGLILTSGPIDNASSCTYNAWSLPVREVALLQRLRLRPSATSTTRAKKARISDTTSQAEWAGYWISLYMTDTFCTKRQRNDRYLRLSGTPCLCLVCNDPAMGADRTALKCKNVRCLQPIPSDARAKLPCRSCGQTTNRTRLKEGKALMKRIDAFYPPPFPATQEAHAVKSPIKVIRKFIAEGERILHPTNVYMVLLYMEAMNFLELRMVTNRIVPA
ncbi:hypothetical protein BV898_17985 [Hypsibius exemplaris]|uniref:Uncharacterized protein n=1 Tax=Hypsibius exemplaris TaxID=2072580 RepID=A0A9X6NGD5_HYPEX|nr:hypothetical protein BV898_17985 [Hypsibius exemplaris]